MDPNSNSTLHVSSSAICESEKSAGNAASTEIAPIKRIVRKITPLDPKKLQQTGLDRKIAEALSKQKSQLNSKSPLSRISSVQTPMLPKVSKSVYSLNMQEASPAKNSIITKKVAPPRITITGPEALTVLNTKNFEDLNPHERLVHVKNLLNKKLLQKKSTEMNDTSNNKQSLQHLQPPSLSHGSSKKNLLARSTSSSYENPQYKLPTKPPKEAKAKPNLFCVLKEAPEVAKATKMETPQKSPQDIVRKLQFQTDVQRKANEESGKQNNFKCLNKNFKEIPKASIKAGTSQQPYKNVKQQSTHEREVFPAKQIYSMANVSQNPKNFQAEYLKQQQIKYRRKEIPNAKTKPCQQYSLQQQHVQPYEYKQLKQSDRKLDFPEISPLKAPFPMVHVPKETPLPAIDSFKKPFNTDNSGCYDFTQKIIAQTSSVWPNYEINQQPATSATATTVTTSTVANSLIVLENKVLTQDEMIDLTELRLSTSAPSFINPHKPMVIKQENTDEYPATTNPSTSINNVEKTSQVKGIKEIRTSNNKMTNANVVVASNKQNKKIIINAQKLKLPPEQLADLARKIKEKTSSAKTGAAKELSEISKVPNIRVLNTANTGTTTTATATTTTTITATVTSTTMTVASIDTNSSRESYTNLGNYVVPPDLPDVMAQYPKEMPVKLFMENNQTYLNVNKRDEPKISNTTCNNNELSKNIVENLKTTKYIKLTESCTPLKNEFNKSAVEIVDEPLDTENSFSAVDFIAALSKANNINDETSLELSPEELNLSASCTMKSSPLHIQSCTSNKKIKTLKTITPKTYKTSSETNINDNLLSDQQMHTIVIKISNGPQTVLTKDSPHKLEDKLQTVKVVDSKILTEIDIEKPSSNLLTTNCPLRQRSELKEAKKPLIDFQDTEAIIAPSPEMSCDPKLLDNMDVKDMEIEDMQATVTIKAGKKKLDDLKIVRGKESTNIKTYIAKGAKSIDPNGPNDTYELNFKTLNAQSNENTENSLKQQTKSPATEQITKTTTNSVSPIKSAKTSYLGAETNQLTEDKTDSNNICNNSPQASKSNADTKDLSQYETCDKMTNSSCPEKVNQKSESATTKRISRFKKGKVNLVQRHKMTQGSNQILCSNDKVSCENKAVGTTKANAEEYKTQLNEKCNKKSSIEIEHENVKAAYQSRTFSGQNADNSKETETITINSIKEIEEVQKTDQTLSISKIMEHADIDESEIIPLDNETLQKNIGPEAKKKFLRKALDSDVPKVSTKLVNCSEKDLNSTKRSMTKSINSDHMNIPKGSVTIDTRSQQNSKTMDICLNKSLNIDNKDIPKSSITVDKNSQQHLKSKETSLSESVDSDIMDVLKSSVKINQIEQQKSNLPEKHLIESLPSITTDVPEPSTYKVTDSTHNLKSLSKSSNAEIGAAPQTTVEISNSLLSPFKMVETASILPQLPKASGERRNSHELHLNPTSSQKHLNSPEERTTKMLESVVTETLKISSNNLPQHLTSVEKNLNTGRLQVSEVSKMDNSLHWHSSSFQRKESLNAVLLDALKPTVNSLEISSREFVESMDIPEPLSKLDSSQQYLNQPPRNLNLNLSEDTDILKVPTKTAGSISQQVSSSTNISIQQSNCNKQEIKSSEMTIVREEVQEEMLEKSSQETQALKTSQTFLEYKKTPHKVSQQPRDEKFKQECGMQLLDKQEAFPSLVDIPKNSPIKLEKKILKIAFKKECKDTSELSKELTTTTTKPLLEQLKSNNEEKDKVEYNLEQSKLPVENEAKSFEKGDGQTVLASKQPSRSGSIDSKSQTEITDIAGLSGTRYSTKVLINDDDLEFLPENSKTNLMLVEIKSPTTLLAPKTTAIIATHKRVQRLYSKPLELELTTPATSSCKRTRFYSQSLERNITIENSFENVKPFERIETNQDNTQDTKEATIGKQLKTIKIKKESQVPHNNNTDSEDDYNDYDCSMKDCEESNEFLGFEEISETNSIKKMSNDARETEHEPKTKCGGTLENWLTTGKAISPTFNKMKNTKRLQDHDEIPASSTSSPSICDSLKKRWDLCSNLNEDTDITDDTSPVDDDEDISKQTPIKKYLKRGSKNVTDGDKELLENKKIKLNDSFQHSSTRPQTKTSSRETDCREKNVRKSPKFQLKKTSSEERVFKIKTEEEKGLKCEKKADDSQEVCEMSDCQQEKALGSRKCQSNLEKCDTNLNSPDFKRLKSKDKTNKQNVARKSIVQVQSPDSIESEKLNALPVIGTQVTTTMKEVDKTENKSCKTKDFNKEREKAKKRLENNDVKDKVSDILMKTVNSDMDSFNSEESSTTKCKQKAQNLNTLSKKPPQTLKDSENDNNKNSANQAKSEKLKIFKTDADESENSIVETEKAEVQNSRTTSQNSTAKRKRGRPKKNLIQTTSMPSDQTCKIEIEQKDLKATIISDPSDNGSVIPPVKKRRIPGPSIKKIENEDSNNIPSSSLNKTQKIKSAVADLEPITPPRLGLIKEETISKSTVGRKRKCNNDEPNFYPRPLLITSTPSDKTCRIGTEQKDLKATIISDPSDSESVIPPAKKRRIQGPSIKKIENEDSNNEFISSSLNKTQNIKSAVDDLEPTATPKLGLTKEETISKPTVGRKPKCNNEPNFNPRLLLITKREQLETNEVITKTQPGTGPIQCGLCLDRTQAAKWTSHLAKHYGVGWQVGEEVLNLENRYVVLKCIMNYMKNTNCKELCCRMCKKVYRSGLGMLTHIETCGAQVIRLKCEFCNKEFAKSSFTIHMRTCFAKSLLENSSADENMHGDGETKEEIFGNSGRLKRYSTIKAENKLKILGAELEKVSDNITTETPTFDPKTRIRYVPPLNADFTAKWSKEIQKLGKASCPKTRCKFSSNDIKELNEHLTNCKYIKTGYFCNYCLQRMFTSEKEAIEHVLKKHQHGRGRKKSENDSDVSIKLEADESSDDNDLSEGANESEIENKNASNEEDDLDNDCDSKKGNKRKKAKKVYRRNLNKSASQTSRKQVFDGRCTDLNKKVYTKWKSFLKLNHSDQPLFTEFITQYSVISNRDYDKYLPTQTVSMKFNLTDKRTLNHTIGEAKENFEWSELKRFESIHNKMNTYLFLGAPVKQCCWLPLPAHVNDQYLAVVYRQEMFKYIKFSQPKQHHTIILIFKVIQKNKIPELNVHYGFLINDGPVHHLSFLPSGGYDECTNRLGLVAIATVTSCIKVCSLPLNVDLESLQANSTADQSVTLIEVKPSFLLNLDILYQKEEHQQHMLLNPQCLQICWSEYLGHQHIFASFSNGFIGIWDITDDPHQNLNRFEVDGILNYVPLNYFYVGEKSVKCFAVHYDTCGPRWLAVSGVYRKFVIYDIKNFSHPIIMKEDINKNILLSMDWCPLWETLLCSYCDAIPNNGRCALTINPTNVMWSHMKIDFMACGVTQIHYTPVTNMCVAAMNNGDLALLDPKELHYEHPLGKQYRGRRMLYSLDIKQLNGQPLVRLPKGNQTSDNDKTHTDWVLHDNNYKEKYGLIFQPLMKINENDKKIYLSENRCPPLNMIPLMRINTLRCNLNFKSKNLIALGYENGFLRLVYFDKDKYFCN